MIKALLIHNSQVRNSYCGEKQRQTIATFTFVYTPRNRTNNNLIYLRSIQNDNVRVKGLFLGLKEV